MKVVVTGGAGFLGSHLCERLLSEGHSVSCIDSLITGSLKNIQHLQAHKDFQFLRQDVTTYLDVEGPVDAVLHFASPASPADYNRLQIHTMKVGALGTHKALGLSRSRGARFLLASTSEVYGDALVNPQNEDYWGNVNPVGPRGVYDEAKRFAEAMTLAYHRCHGLDVRIARIFNAYGPRMRAADGRVVSNFVVQALEGKDLTVYGDGTQTRSLCYVDDLIEGVLRLLMAGEADRGDRACDVHAPVNLGNPQEITVNEIAALVIRMTRSSSRVCRLPLPADDPKVRCPDISRARKLLQWEPVVDLETGLLRTIDYFRNVLSTESLQPSV